MARATVWEGLAKLESLGLIWKIRRRVRVGWVSRQATSIYVFGAKVSELRTPSTEFTRQTVFRGLLWWRRADGL
jgi:hypothetical protein